MKRLPKGTRLIRPGKVKVAALPSVDPSDWDPSDTQAQVDEVRQSMLDCLIDLIALD
ncbi:MAG: hypothetical protein ACR2HR_16630 [Euzebya sp.]